MKLSTKPSKFKNRPQRKTVQRRQRQLQREQRDRPRSRQQQQQQRQRRRGAQSCCREDETRGQKLCQR